MTSFIDSETSILLFAFEALVSLSAQASKPLLEHILFLTGGPALRWDFSAARKWILVLQSLLWFPRRVFLVFDELKNFFLNMNLHRWHPWRWCLLGLRQESRAKGQGLYILESWRSVRCLGVLQSVKLNQHSLATAWHTGGHACPGLHDVGVSCPSGRESDAKVDAVGICFRMDWMLARSQNMLGLRTGCEHFLSLASS